MSTRTGRVIAREGESTLVEFDPGCRTCQGCAHQQSRCIQLPGSFNHEVSLDLSLKAQTFALFYSLLLPILFAVLATFVADWLLLNEGWGIIAALCGFTIGMVLCRPLGLSALTVVEK